MLSDNIKRYRKEIGMSQDELAEKLDVSRQSVSLWETGQTQPTIENVISLAKIFGITSDALLADSDGASPAENDAAPDDRTDNAPDGAGDAAEKNPADPDEENADPGKKKKTLILITAIAAAAVIAGVILMIVLFGGGNKKDAPDLPGASSDTEALPAAVTSDSAESDTANGTDTTAADGTPDPEISQDGEASTNSGDAVPASAPDGTTTAAPPVTTPAPVITPAPEPATSPVTTAPPVKNPPEEKFDLFAHCRDFAIKKGTVNGDYCMYQQPATLYGGYSGEYFSVSYWNNSNMVEFCLHCPLSETQSINFYLRMRGGYDGKYEYWASKYYRSSGEGFRDATGYIDPAVFSDKYPLNCTEYIGSADGQSEFMEECRVGMCDLIKCLRGFVQAENMGCDFSVFGFVNF